MRILVVGDLCLGGDVERRLLEESAYDPLEGLRPLMGEDSVLIANVECVLSLEGRPLDKYATLRADPRVLKALHGLDVAVVANNHVGDFGPDAARETVAELHRAGFVTAGWGENLSESLQATVLEKDGVRLGVIACSCLSTNGRNWASSESAGVAPLSLGMLRQTLTKARAHCDLVVVYVHWGVEESHAPVPGQVRAAHRLIEWGADAVIGSHAHVIQTYEQYRGKWVFYGLGNYLFADVAWSKSMPNGSVETGMKTQSEENRQSLCLELVASRKGDRFRLDLVHLHTMEFQGDLVPRRIETGNLTFDLESLNRRQAKFFRRNSDLLAGDHEIRYETRFKRMGFSHTYADLPFDRGPRNVPLFCRAIGSLRREIGNRLRSIKIRKDPKRI